MTGRGGKPSAAEKGQIMNRQEEELWRSLEKRLQSLEQKCEALSPEELTEAV